MATGARKFWEVPDLPDPEQRREVAVLFGVVRPLVVVMLLYSAALLVLPNVEARGFSVFMTFSFAAILSGCLWLGHRGRVRAGANLAVASFFPGTIASIMMLGGMEGPLAGGFVTLVAMAGLLRGWRGAVVYSAVGALGLGFAAWAEAVELVPGWPTPITYDAATVTNFVTLAFTAVIVGVATRALDRSAGEAEREGQRAQETAAHLQQLIEQAPAGVLQIDLEGRVIAVNPEIERMSGYTREELLGRHLRDLPAPEGVTRVILDAFARNRDGKRDSKELELRRKDGTPFTVQTYPTLVERAGQPALVQVVIIDITERRQLELKLAEAARLESIGRLAGGVAHDFRNLLTVVLGNADLVKNDERLPPELREDLAAIEGAGRQAEALTQQLLAFARKQDFEPEVVDPNAVLHKLQDVFKRLIRADIELELDLQPLEGSVVIDPVQLERVVVNLVVNARDSMPRAGRIEIATRRVEGVAGAEPLGPAAVISVTDTGAGMDRATTERVFEPFFTTKGGGTGLGLATVHGIVLQSGGRVSVTSTPGEGTRFEVRLPLVDRVATDTGADDPESPANDLQRPLVALVVDDRPDVRKLVCRALEARGHKVTVAEDGRAALEKWAKLAQLDVMVTDIVMPGMGGAELARELRSSDPTLPVLFISGYADAQLHGEGVVIEPGPQTARLDKPFTAHDLVRAVERLVAAAKQADRASA